MQVSYTLFRTIYSPPRRFIDYANQRITITGSVDLGLGSLTIGYLPTVTGMPVQFRSLNSVQQCQTVRHLVNYNIFISDVKGMQKSNYTHVLHTYMYMHYIKGDLRPSG